MPERSPISKETLRQLKESIDLREIAAQYTTLRGHLEKFGPCPRCGGEDRFHVQAKMFFCRQCYPPEPGHGRHDVFEFAIFLGLATNFRQACELAISWTNVPLSPVRQVQPVPHPLSYLAPEWQQPMQQNIQRFAHRLESGAGTAARTYLRKRGILPETWRAARLGALLAMNHLGHRHPVVAIPWFYEGFVTSVQMRFIYPQQQRYARYGYRRCYGETVLYTLPQKGEDTLVAVEGEFNALSIWQATPFEVVSFGGQNFTAQTQEALLKAAHGFDTVLVWADEPQLTQELCTLIGDNAQPILSNADANELLQRGQLEKFLESLR